MAENVCECVFQDPLSLESFCAPLQYPTPAHDAWRLSQCELYQIACERYLEALRSSVRDDQSEAVIWQEAGKKTCRDYDEGPDPEADLWRAYSDCLMEEAVRQCHPRRALLPLATQVSEDTQALLGQERMALVRRVAVCYEQYAICQDMSSSARTPAERSLMQRAADEYKCAVMLGEDAIEDPFVATSRKTVMDLEMLA
jgi:AcrR family transcriptional regulator